MRIPKLRIVGVVTVGLLGFTGIAMAQEGVFVPREDTGPDTGMNFGYDQENEVFMFNVNDLLGDTFGCTVAPDAAGNTRTVVYGVDGEQITVDELKDNQTGDPVEFSVYPDVTPQPEGEETPIPEPGADEVTDALPPATIEYGGWRDDPASWGQECELQAAEIAGPNGQINHGMFMKLWNSLWDGRPGRGCLNRYLAQSDFGKGEQQVKVGDRTGADEAEPGIFDDPESLSSMEFDVLFQSVQADCQHGKGKSTAAASDTAKGNSAAASAKGNNGKGHVEAGADEAAPTESSTDAGVTSSPGKSGKAKGPKN